MSRTSSVSILATNVEAALKSQIVELRTEIAIAKQQGDVLNNCIAKERKLRETVERRCELLLQDISQRDATLVFLEKEIGERDLQIGALQREVDDKRAMIKGLCKDLVVLRNQTSASKSKGTECSQTLELVSGLDQS